MTRTSPLPTWLKVTVVAVAAVVLMRYLAAIEAGVDHVTAIRTYLFWGLVCAPVAYLADQVIRTVVQYRFVRLAVAKVKVREDHRR